MASTLIYVGAGLDSEFLDLMDYPHYKLYDALPSTQHYNKGTAGYKHTKTRKCFMRALRRAFGTFEKRSGQELYFPGHNIQYKYGADSKDVCVPPGDILIRGFNPCAPQWRAAFKDPRRNLYLACNTDPTAFEDCRYEVVCFCEHGYCQWEDSD